MRIDLVTGDSPKGCPASLEAYIEAGISILIGKAGGEEYARSSARADRLGAGIQP